MKMNSFIENSTLNVTLNLPYSLSKHGKYLIIQIYDGSKSLINQIILWDQKCLKKNKELKS